MTAPLNVLGVGKTGDEYRRYISAAAIVQSALAFAFGALLIGAAAVAMQFNAETGLMLLALAVAAMGWQYQEFIRRVLFAESRVAAVLVNDGLTQGLRLSALCLLFVSGGLTGSRLFLLLGLSWFGGTALGIWQIRGSLTLRINLATIRDVARDHWHFGRWLIVTNAVSYVPWFLTAASMASILTTSAYGAYHAFDQIVAGAYVPMQALHNLLRPRLSRDARQGPRAAWRTMLPIMKLGGAAFAILGLGLIVTQELLFGLIYGEEYAPFVPSMYLLAFTPLALLLKSVLTIALQTFRITRPIFVAAIISAIVHSGAALVVFQVFGLYAAGAPELLGFSTGAAFLAWTWRKHLNAERSRLDDAQPRTPPGSGWLQWARPRR